jgi:hypothetical protein
LLFFLSLWCCSYSDLELLIFTFGDHVPPLLFVLLFLTSAAVDVPHLSCFFAPLMLLYHTTGAVVPQIMCYCSSTLVYSFLISSSVVPHNRCCAGFITTAAVHGSSQPLMCMVPHNHCCYLLK